MGFLDNLALGFSVANRWEEPFDTPWKTRQFDLTDPSGFKLTVSSEWPR